MRFGIPVLASVISVLTLASLGHGQQSCCVNAVPDSFLYSYADTSNLDSVKILPGSTCDTMAIAWYSSTGLYSITYIIALKKIGADLRMTITTSLPGLPPSVDTIPDWCQIAVEKALPTRLTLVKASPNPFKSRVEIQFNNPDGRADVQVFDARGRMLRHWEGVRESRITWQPKGLRPGLYLAKIAVQGRIRYCPIVCVK